MTQNDLEWLFRVKLDFRASCFRFKGSVNTLILGVIPLDQIADVWVNPSENLKLRSSEIIF